MNEPDLTEIAALIDQSSLGTCEAVALRAATSPDTVRQVVRDAMATRPEAAVAGGQGGMTGTDAVAGAAGGAIAAMASMAAMAGALAAGADALAAAAASVAGVTGSAAADTATTDADLQFESLDIAAAPPVIGL